MKSLQSRTRGPKNLIEILETLERRGVITTDPDDAEECCGIRRDEDGLCQHRPGHPVYVKIGDLA